MSDTVSILSLLYIFLILPIIPLYRTLNTHKQGERGDHMEQGDEEEQKNLMWSVMKTIACLEAIIVLRKYANYILLAELSDI